MAKNWRNDKVRVKVLNLESPGSDVSCELNGHNYLIQHGAECNLPRAIVSLLKETTMYEVDVEGDLNKGGTVKKKVVGERVFVTELGEAVAEAKDKVLDKLKKNKDID